MSRVFLRRRGLLRHPRRAGRHLHFGKRVLEARTHRGVLRFRTDHRTHLRKQRLDVRTAVVRPGQNLLAVSQKKAHAFGSQVPGHEFFCARLVAGPPWAIISQESQFHHFITSLEKEIFAIDKGC